MWESASQPILLHHKHKKCQGRKMEKKKKKIQNVENGMTTIHFKKRGETEMRKKTM